MQYITGLSRVQLLTHDTDTLTQAQWADWQTLQARRIGGEPMAYVIGKREFYGRDFVVNPDVLIPRPDTETLIDAVLADVVREDVALVDLGTGSGAIALTLAAERPSWRVCASDVSRAALAVARENAQRLNAHVEFFEGDWWHAFPEGVKFDVVVSNPPYIQQGDEHLTQGDVRFEPMGALSDGADGLAHYRVILGDVARFLQLGGAVYFEHGYNQGMAVRALMQVTGFELVRTLRDLGGNERITTGIFQSNHIKG